MTPESQLPSSASVVIIGAGIVGTSAAYYLTSLGQRDVVALDQGLLFEVLGSTSHAPGLVFQTNPSRTVCRLAAASVELYRSLQHEGEPCFYPVGSMEVACSKERHQDLKRRFGFARSWGLPAELITAGQARELIPILDSSRIHSAYYVPSDGVAKGVRLLRALTGRARAAGARFFADTPVTGVEKGNGRVRAVLTAGGRIETDNVLLCAGIWGPRIGRMAGVPVPMLPLQHFYARTSPLPELTGETREVVHPIVRNQDRAMYFRQHGDCYGIGSYRHEPLPVGVDELTAGRAALAEFSDPHFAEGLAAAIELFPALKNVELTKRINGMFAFTPDGHSLIGPSMYLDGFWLAEAVWVTHAGGVGQAIAEYMVQGYAGIDLHELDCNRFHAHTFTPAYVRRRGVQQYREVYDVIHPLQQMEEPRGLRVSPFHRRQQELGAVFFESAGWERPQWYTANEKLIRDSHPPPRDAWTVRYWSPIIATEHLATRDRVAMFDLTPFTKLEISGRGALDFLQYLAANEMDQPLGRTTYTALLNEGGGIECDLTVTRQDTSRFLVVTGGSAGMHDLAWIRRGLPRDGSVHIANLTSAQCTLGVWGPRARDLLQSVSEDDLSAAAFPYLTAREIQIGHAPAVALRISYVGELGWEIYIPTEYGLYVWDTLWEAGQRFGVTAAGGGAFESLRLEKGYRLWGADIDVEHNPYEAGLGFAVRLNKGPFRGRSALEEMKRRGVHNKLCCLTLDNPCAIVMGKEPILHGGAVIGYVTSAAYGYSIGRGIAYGYLPPEFAVQGARTNILFFNERIAATVCREPLFDPENLRLRS
jgi:glycine cleavage system aminomethyltransferase T/glycine/D-amino acid oxidase-like deaminating enzyme